MRRHLLVSMALLLAAGCGGSEPKPGPARATLPLAPDIDAVIKTIDEMPVACVSRVGSYDGVAGAVGELYRWAAGNRVTLVGLPFGVYHDNPGAVPPESTRYDVCVRVSLDVTPDGVVTPKTLGPYVVASTVHTGRYGHPSPTYGKLGQWAASQGYAPAGPVVEFYMDDPAATPVESLRAEVCFVVTKVTE